MLATVVRTIARYDMLRPGMRVGVAVSGGADSVCLLHLLLELAPRWGAKLTVLHLNHNLRGAESREDARFVCALAASLGLPFVGREANPAAEGGNLEEAGRRARLAFFAEMIATGVDRVATGHTLSDQAETVLYRFLRGAGTAGLAGIRPVTSEGLIRPLIEVDRRQVERYLSDQGIPWRTDSTNESSDFARNRIRHALLPQLVRDWNPAVPETLARTAEWARAEEEFWAGHLDELAKSRLTISGQSVVVSANWLMQLPLAVSRRLVRRAIEMMKGDLRGTNFADVETVLALAQSRNGTGRVQAHGVEVARSFDWLRFAAVETDGVATANSEVAAPVPGVVEVPGSGRPLSLEVIENSETSVPEDSVYNGGMGLDWSSLPGSLVLRNWRSGDRYQPWGSARERKIKSLFQKARIPSWERRFWPILTDGSSIVWAQQFGPAARFAATPRSKRIVRVTLA